MKNKQKKGEVDNLKALNESFDSDEIVKVDPISFREKNAMLDII